MKKLMFILTILFIFPSCLYKTNKVEESKSMSISLSSSTFGDSEEIKVQLENILTKKTYLGSAARINNKINTLTFEKIFYGIYALDISIYRNEEMYAKISDFLHVSLGENSVFKGVVGAPNKFSEISRNAEVYFIDGYEKDGKKCYYASFKFNPVSSNYLTDYYDNHSSELTEEEIGLDTITYKLYVGTSMNLSDKDFKYSMDSSGNIIDVSYSYNRNTTNTTIDYLQDRNIFVHDSNEYVGKVFYWKVVAVNGRGSQESEVLPFIVTSKTYDDFSTDEETGGIDLITLIDTIGDIADWIDWLI